MEAVAVQVAGLALEYCLSDMQQGAGPQETGVEEAELEGLPLLVLGDRTVATLQRRNLRSRQGPSSKNTGSDVYLVSAAERELFSSLNSCMVTWEVTPFSCPREEMRVSWSIKMAYKSAKLTCRATSSKLVCHLLRLRFVAFDSS